MHAKDDVNKSEEPCEASKCVFLIAEKARHNMRYINSAITKQTADVRMFYSPIIFSSHRCIASCNASLSYCQSNHRWRLRTYFWSRIAPDILASLETNSI